MRRDLEHVVEIAPDQVGLGERLEARGDLGAGDLRQARRQQAPLQGLRCAVALFVQAHVLQCRRGAYREVPRERQLFIGIATAGAHGPECHRAEDPAARRKRNDHERAHLESAQKREVIVGSGDAG